MAGSSFLRTNLNQHIVKNSLSKGQDKDIDVAVQLLVENLRLKYPTLTFEHSKRLLLSDIIEQLKRQFPNLADKFTAIRDSSFIKPDGGFLFAVNPNGERRLILVSEVKRQGTNDARLEEGLRKQALGNAIERLGKNVIGLRAIFKAEGIFPFVCFGNGYDFRDESSIIDRVKTINDFFPLNQIIVRKDYLPFEPASFFFRYEPWTVEEMVEIMLQVCSISIEYKFV